MADLVEVANSGDGYHQEPGCGQDDGVARFAYEPAFREPSTATGLPGELARQPLELPQKSKPRRVGLSSTRDMRAKFLERTPG